MKDLFGVEIVERKKHSTGGYAAPPGSGPENETCKTCKHYRSIKYHDKSYRKYALVKWTHGPGTDILAKSPACKWWTFPDFLPEIKFDLGRPRTANYSRWK